MRTHVLICLTLALAGCAGPDTSDAALDGTQGPAPLAPADEDSGSMDRPDPERTDDPPAEATEEAPTDVHASLELVWLAGAGVEGVAGASAMSSERFLAIEVPEGAARLEVEGAWSCLHPVCLAGLHVYGPGWSPSAVLQPADAEARGDMGAQVDVDAPEPGTGHVFINPEGAHASFTGNLKATAVMA